MDDNGNDLDCHWGFGYRFGTFDTNGDGQYLVCGRRVCVRRLCILQFANSGTDHCMLSCDSVVYLDCTA